MGSLPWTMGVWLAACSVRSKAAQGRLPRSPHVESGILKVRLLSNTISPPWCSTAEQSTRLVAQPVSRSIMQRKQSIDRRIGQEAPGKAKTLSSSQPRLDPVFRGIPDLHVGSLTVQSGPRLHVGS